MSEIPDPASFENREPPANSMQEVLKKLRPKGYDPVNHPWHYTSYNGIEVIQLTEQMNFNKGNAVKYIARAGLKNPDTEIQDLEKAQFYINREINRLRGNT